VAGFYTSNGWVTIRARQLAREPICRGCERKRAREVDHIKPISEGGAARDPSNLQSLCRGCHRAKTNVQRRGLVWVADKHRGCDANGYPLDPAHPWNASSASLNAADDVGRSITSASRAGTVRPSNR
jgi:predicted Fe-S protein YdhL (DUF1289 family)